MTADTIAENAERWCQPISSTSFGGAPSRDDDAYQQVLVHLGHLQSLHDEACDWEMVQSAADRLLRKKTKDMTLLGALCVALLQREGFGGLAAGLQAYQRLVEDHSSEMFPLPKRKRGRAGAFSWLTSQLEREVPSRKADVSDHEAIVAGQQALLGLEAVLREELGALHPRMGPLRKLFEELAERTTPAPTPDLEPQPEPVEHQTAQAGSDSASDAGLLEEEGSSAVASGDQEMPAARPTPPPPPVGPVPIDSEDTARSALEAAASELKRIAQYYLKEDPRHPVGLQLAQMGSFAGVVPGGTRAPQGLSLHQMGTLKEAVDQGRFGDALAQVPDMLEADLSLNALFQLARAAEGLGDSRVLACIVGAAIGSYIQMDGLVDGSSETIQWLTDLRRPPEPPAPELDEQPDQLDSPPEPSMAAQLEEESSDAARDEQQLADLVAQAEEVALRDGIGSGCLVLQEALEARADPPSRFRLRLALAKLCSRFEAPEVASPLLREMYRELGQPVHDWDLDLVADLASAVLDCNRRLDAQGPDPERTAESSQMRAVLARVDPERALRERF